MEPNNPNPPSPTPTPGDPPATPPSPPAAGGGTQPVTFSPTQPQPPTPPSPDAGPAPTSGLPPAPADWANPSTPSTSSAAPAPTTNPIDSNGYDTGVPAGMVTGQHSGGPGKKKLIIILVAVVALVLAAALIFFFMMKDGKDKKNTSTTQSASQAAKESTDSASEEGVDLATIQAVTLVPPTDMSAYKAPVTLLPTYSQYLTLSSACSLDVGTVPTSYTALKGNTLDEVVDYNVQLLRDSGATVADVTAGEALILKDAKDSSVQYKLPTLKFSITKGTATAVSNYSVVVTKNGDRVVVTRACASQNSQVTEDDLKPINETAKKITVSIP